MPKAEIIPGFATKAALASHEAAATNIHQFSDYQGRRIQLFNPYIPRANRYKVQLHAHTTNSDGVNTPVALATAYRNAGYHALCITDHNFMTPDPGVPNILHINGVEENTNAYFGHMISIGCTAQSTSSAYQDVINDILRDGALVGMSHTWAQPAAIDFTILRGLMGFQMIEVENHQVFPVTDWSNWLKLVKQQRNVWSIAVDDCHNIAGAAFNKAFVEVNADTLSVVAIKASLRDGNFYCRQTGAPQLTVTISGNQITATLDGTGNISFRGRDNAVLKAESNVTTSTYTIQGWEGYVYVYATDSSSTYATWSQPIWILNGDTPPIVEDATTNVHGANEFEDLFVAALGRSNFEIIPTMGWIASVAGSGATTQLPTRMIVNTGVTASSRGLLYSSNCGLNEGGVYSRVNWDKRLVVIFNVTRWNSDTECIGRFQLKPVATEGALAAKGIGLKIVNLALWAESYGTELGEIDLGTTLADYICYQIKIVLTQTPIPSIRWYVNGVLKTTQYTTAKIPSGLSAASEYMVFSIINGATGGVDCYAGLMDLRIWQAR